MAFYRAAIGGGGGGISEYTNPMSSVSSAGTNFSFSNFAVGKKLLVLLFYHTGSAMAYNRFDGATASNGTISKLCNLRNTNGTAQGTFFNLEVTGSNCSVTAPYSCFCQVFEAV